MNFIAVDTSGAHMTLIINKGNERFIRFEENCGVNHSVALMPALEDMLKEANFNLSDADFFACVIGPGSFTGIRIGVSTVKALAYSVDKPVLAVTSLETAAYTDVSGKKLAVIDAGHDGYYVAAYDGLKETVAPCYIKGEKLRELIGEYSVLSFTDLKGIPYKKVNPAEGLYNACVKKEKEVSGDADSLVPLYVRKSQAEEGR